MMRFTDEKESWYRTRQHVTVLDFDNVFCARRFMDAKKIWIKTGSKCQGQTLNEYFVSGVLRSNRGVGENKFVHDRACIRSLVLCQLVYGQEEELKKTRQYMTGLDLLTCFVTGVLRTERGAGEIQAVRVRHSLTWIP